MHGAGRVRDVIIVGSGPAGYTAAIYAACAGLDTLVIEGHVPGCALMAAGQMDNYPGFSGPVCGPSLARAMRAQAHRFGAEFHTGDVDGFDLEGDDIDVAAVFVAIGQTPRSDLLVGLVDFDARGFVQTRGQGTHTYVDGVFAAGDLIDRRQAIPRSRPRSVLTRVIRAAG